MIHGGGHGWWSFLHHDESEDRPTVSRALLRRVLAWGWPYRWSLVAMLGCILGSTLFGLVPPLLYRDLIDYTLPNRDFGRLNLLALGMIGIPLVNGLLGVVQRYFSSRVGEGVIFDLRCALFQHLQRMPLRFFTHTRTGELMSRLNNDVVGAQQAVNNTIISVVSNVVTVALTLTIMLSLEWRLTLLAVGILPLFMLPVRRVGTVLRQLSREAMSVNAQMSALMNETLNVSGALLVKLFGRAPDENRRFAERAARVRDIGVRQAFVGRWFFLILSLVSAAGTAVVFWIGGQLVLRGEFTAGTIIAFGAYLTQLYGPISSLANARVEFVTSLVSFERVFEVLDLPIEVGDRPRAQPLEQTRGHVRFEDVSFSYQPDDGIPIARLGEVTRWGRRGGEPPPLTLPEDIARLRQERPADHGERRWALQDVSFEIRPGQLAALVGPSGAGKTTVTYLLPRLYDPTDGRITIDGHDLRDLSLQSLSRQIGMVTQECYLFHDTIRANLRYARPEATDAELEAACGAAHIHEFIAGLPDGYDTIVGERGYRLSGGEKQRVAIARVILKDPRILVLDEATSHLDSQSEALIQAALTEVMRGRTSLVIAHRLSTILAADVILVLSQGRLVEQGTHEELLARGGLYARLYETQFRPRVGPRAAHVRPG
ncbi:MAG: ABC transporter ATP-binding protein [Chloroflexi bacterium]|nr:ABC transporter ATP-binding protein [Chloroflexota bacterium]